MMRIVWMLVAVSLVVSPPAGLRPIGAQDAAVPSGTFDRSIDVGGVERTYRVHVPDLPEPTDGFPVLIVLHGGGGNGKQVERATGFSRLADAEGFVAVYPDGTGRLERRLTWNAHNCCAYANAEGVDDVGFVAALIDRLASDALVDPARISVTGHSNGAMMTFRVACELSGRIAAAAPYAGALNTDTCAPSSPVPMLIMNGEDDQNVPIAGGVSTNVGFPGEDSRIDRPTSFAVDTWVSANGCSEPPVVDHASAATVTSWTGCAGGSAVEQMLIHDWEHGWPSPENSAPIDASTVIWEFVSQFSKPAD